jgi:uncharacterized protein (TIGR02453 family)
LRIDPWKSLHRIHRDIRFSQDKSPYKTHVAAGFYTVPGEAGGAGLYFYVSAKEIAAGGGIYMPSSPQLKSIRQRLVLEPDQFQQIIEDKQIRRRFGGIRGERLQRPPQGFSPDDPMIDYLKLKQFYFIRSYDIEISSKPQFADRIAGDLIPLLPFVEWLNRALKSS